MTERPLITDFRIHDTIQRHAARYAERVGPGCLMQPLHKLKHRLFKDHLERSRNVMMLLLERSSARARQPKPFRELRRLYRIVTVTGQSNDVAKLIGVSWFAV